MTVGYVTVKGLTEEETTTEIPIEPDGTLLLSTVTAQFPKAVGLRFKSEEDSWRGVSLDENGVMVAPPDGWEDIEFSAVVPKKKGGKRAAAAEEGPLEKLSRMTEDEILTDLIVLGLPYVLTEEEMRKYFSTYGELELCEIKLDSDKKSRGFGFIRFKEVDAVKAVLEAKHTLEGREVEIRFPKEDAKLDSQPTKVFIGRLPRGTTVDELRVHFEEFGAIKDVYIPEPFRGFGFVTFESPSVAEDVMNSTHVIKDTYVNVANPSSKKPKGEENANKNKSGGNMQMQGQPGGQPGGPPPLLGMRYGGGGYYNGNYNYFGPIKATTGNYGWSKS